MLRTVTADETGLFKLVELKKKQVASKWGRQSRKNGAVKMSWVPGLASTLASINGAGVVEFWDPRAGAHISSTKNAGEGCVYLAPHGGDLLSVTKDGTVRLFEPGIRDADSGAKSKFEAGPNVSTARLSPTGSGLLALGGKEHDLQLYDMNEGGKKVFQAKNVGRDWLDRVVPIWVAAISFLPSNARVGLPQGDFSEAALGRHQSKLADVGNLVTEEEAQGWAAIKPSSAKASSGGGDRKKPKGEDSDEEEEEDEDEEIDPDLVALAGPGGLPKLRLELKEKRRQEKIKKEAAAKKKATASSAVALSSSSVALAAAGAPSMDGPDAVIAVATGHKHVRIYDTRAQASPVLNVDCGDYPFTAMLSASIDNGGGDHHYLITADTIGTIRQLDIRQTLRQTGGYHGAAGSIRDLALHPSGKPYFAAVGLDRFLRVYHLTTREQVRHVYLKQRLNCVLWDEPEPTPAAGKKGKRGASGKKGGAGEDELKALREADLDDSEGDGEEEDELRAEQREPHRIAITHFPKADRLFPLVANEEGEDDEEDGEEEEIDEEDEEDGELDAAEDEEEEEDDDGEEEEEEDGDAKAGQKTSTGSSEEEEDDSGAGGKAALAAKAAAIAEASKAAYEAELDEDDSSEDVDDDEDDDDEDDEDDEEDSLLDFDDDDDDDDDDEDEDDEDDSGGSGDDGGRGKKGGKKGAADDKKKGGKSGKAGPPAAKRRRKDGGDGGHDSDADVDLFLGEGKKADQIKRDLKVERKRLEKMGGGGGAGAGGGKKKATKKR